MRFFICFFTGSGTILLLYCLIEEEVRNVEPSALKHLSKMDEDTLRRLMEAYGQDVWNYIYFFTKKRDIADDLSQEVFLKAYTHIQQFRGESSVKTWLLSIARNMAMNYTRTAYFRKVLLVDFIQRKESSSSAEQQTMERMGMNQLWNIVFNLQPKFREVLLLEAHYGLSMKEIAEMLGISEGTVKSRLYRARAKVGEAWKEELNYETI